MRNVSHLKFAKATSMSSRAPNIHLPSEKNISSAICIICWMSAFRGTSTSLVPPPFWSLTEMYLWWSSLKWSHPICTFLVFTIFWGCLDSVTRLVIVFLCFDFFLLSNSVTSCRLVSLSDLSLIFLSQKPRRLKISPFLIRPRSSSSLSWLWITAPISIYKESVFLLINESYGNHRNASKHS